MPRRSPTQNERWGSDRLTCRPGSPRISYRSVVVASSRHAVVLIHGQVTNLSYFKNATIGWTFVIMGDARRRSPDLAETADRGSKPPTAGLLEFG